MGEPLIKIKGPFGNSNLSNESQSEEADDFYGIIIYFHHDDNFLSYDPSTFGASKKLVFKQAQFQLFYMHVVL